MNHARSTNRPTPMPAPPATRRTRNQRSRVVIPTREKPLTIEGCHHINLRSTDGVLPLPPLPSQVATVVKHVLRIVDERYLTNVETAVVTQMTGLTERVKIPSSKSGWLDDSLLPLARGRAACTKELRARLGRWREGGGCDGHLHPPQRRSHQGIHRRQHAPAGGTVYDPLLNDG
jgi:hypothetical protein